MRYTKEQVNSFTWGVIAGLGAAVIIVAFIFTAMSVGKETSATTYNEGCLTTMVDKPLSKCIDK